jgi:Ca2+/H+ antiporter
VLIGMLRPYQPTGALVRMLTRIVLDIKWFMLVQVILLGGFLGALMVMVQGGGKKNGSLRAPLALLTGFAMMLGDWDTEELYQNQAKALQLSAVIAFVVYALVVVVVCMNTVLMFSCVSLACFSTSCGVAVLVLMSLSVLCMCAADRHHGRLLRLHQGARDGGRAGAEGGGAVRDG